jgi:hypothetical protein
MANCHEHNLREPLPETRPYGIRVTVRGNDPFRRLVGDDWHREHWFATRPERDSALESMKSRYPYFRPGDTPSLEFACIDARTP